MRYLIILALTAILAACSSVPTQLADGYQFGDLTAMQQEYCSTANPEQRANLLAILRLADVPVPPSGVCTSISSVGVPGADVEQAREDKERFSSE